MRHHGAVNGWLIALVLVMGTTAGGCARQRTVRTSESVRVETVREGEPRPQGVLSGLVHVVGEVLALPFRLVGGLLRVIF